ncbi:hypothetical protein FOZ63_009457, partial [Perkinsus olseni]
CSGIKAEPSAPRLMTKDDELNSGFCSVRLLLLSSGTAQSGFLSYSYRRIDGRVTKSSHWLRGHIRVVWLFALPFTIPLRIVRRSSLEGALHGPIAEWLECRLKTTRFA